jgi:hypothetical protein
VTEDSRSPDQLSGEALDEDTPADAAAVETEENTPQAQQPDDTTDWKQRYESLRPAFDRGQQRNRELENALIRQAADQQRQASAADPLSERERILAQREAQLQWEREWAEIERRYPPEVVEAYRAASRNWQLDPSPLGAINGFIAGADTLLERRLPASQPQTPPAASRKEAARPRVDTSRSEPDSAAIEKQIAGAQATHDLKGGVMALLRRGPNTSAPKG